MKQEIKLKSRRRSLLRMLVFLANKSEDPDEAYSAGLVGLALAIKYWKPDRGTEFTTFAYTIIKQAISAASYNPRQLKAVKIKVIRRLFYEKTGRELQPEQLASLIDEDAATIHDLLNNNRRDFLSLEQLLESDNDETESNHSSVFIDKHTLSPEAAFTESDKNIVAESVQNILNELPDNERSLLTLYFGIGLLKPLLQEEIGLLFGMTYQAVQYQIRKLLEKLSSNRKLQELYTEVET